MKREINIEEFIRFVRSIYGEGKIPLHRPKFDGNEKQYLEDCIDSNFVSSAGERIQDFENSIAKIAQCKHAVATVTGTAAIQVSLRLAGVERGDEVITQALTFIATCNAVSYLGASPVFIDVDVETVGMCPESLEKWLENHAVYKNGKCYNKNTGARLAACLPVHIFGLPCRILEIANVCNKYDITLVEDAAEALGSSVGSKHVGTFGQLGTLSFNGNKIVTCGGGGAILTNDSTLAKMAKHLTTTAKISHKWEYAHDLIGYNYRLPNLNAALGLAQLEQLPKMLTAKKEVAEKYIEFFDDSRYSYLSPLQDCHPNYWLNAILLESESEKNIFLEETNNNGILTRPLWQPISSLPMYSNCERSELDNSHYISERIINVPSSVP